MIPTIQRPNATAGLMMAPLTSRKKMQLRKKPKAAKMGPQMPSGGSATDAVYLPLRAARSRIVSGVACHAGSRFYQCRGALGEAAGGCAWRGAHDEERGDEGGHALGEGASHPVLRRVIDRQPAVVTVEAVRAQLRSERSNQGDEDIQDVAG